MTYLKAQSDSSTISWPLQAYPQVILAGRYKLDDKNFCYSYKNVDVYSLHLYDYHGRVRTGTTIHSLRPGDLMLSPLGAETSYDLSRPGHHYCIHFKHCPIKKKAEQVELPLHIRLGTLKSEALRRFHHISQCATAAKRDRVLATTGAVAMQELLLWLAMNHRTASQSPVPGRAYPVVEQTANLLVQRLHQPLSVPELAEEVGLSQNYLASQFRQRFGMTIPRYLLTRRIEYALHLLVTTNIPIKEIAQRIGLPEPRHFNKQFRLLVGVTPSAFRLTQTLIF